MAEKPVLVVKHYPFKYYSECLLCEDWDVVVPWFFSPGISRERLYGEAEREMNEYVLRKLEEFIKQRGELEVVVKITKKVRVKSIEELKKLAEDPDVEIILVNAVIPLSVEEWRDIALKLLKMGVQVRARNVEKVLGAGEAEEIRAVNRIIRRFRKAGRLQELKELLQKIL
jgi:hypothetical protein